MRTMCGILVLLFLFVPAIEIYVIIQVGEKVGPWPTLAVVLVTAVVGAVLVKSQGLAVLQRLKSTMMEGGRGAAKVVAESVLILIAGIVLMTPGFCTDALGIALLVPRVRSKIADRIVEKVKLPGIISSGSGSHQPQNGQPKDPASKVIDV